MTVRGRDLGASPADFARLERIGDGARESACGDRFDVATGHLGKVLLWRRQQTYAVVMLCSGPDVEVCAERFRDLGAKDRAQGLPRCAPDDLAKEIALRERVIPARRAGWPPGRLRREQLTDFLMIVEVLCRNWSVEARKASRVRE